MGLFKKIRSVVIGNLNDNQNTADDSIVSNNSIENQAALMKSIEKTLKSYYKGQQFSFSDKILKIWVTDGLLFNSLRESDFVTELKSYLDNELGAVFSSVELRPGPLPAQHDFTQINDTAYIELYGEVVIINSIKAEIRSLPYYGSLKKERYVFSSMEIEKTPSQRYNIGIGEYPEVKGFRQNHIAVDDDPESPEFSKNRYVSRKHAFIRYSLETGFLLQAEFEGTQKAGKRTRILREEQIIEVDDVVAQPLKDGDCIELSKNVRFMFKIINE
jgi:hypothetical protein